MFINWYTSGERIFSFFPFCESLWNHSWIFFFKLVCYNSLPSLLCVMLKLSQIWPVGAPWNQFLCLYDMIPLSTSMLTGITRCSRLTCTCVPQTWNHAFSQEAQVSLSGEYLENWQKGCSCWLWDVVACKPFPRTELGNILEKDSEFQLKYNVTEFFLTLFYCTLVSVFRNIVYFYLLCLWQRRVTFSFMFRRQ